MLLPLLLSLSIITILILVFIPYKNIRALRNFSLVSSVIIFLFSLLIWADFTAYEFLWGLGNKKNLLPESEIAEMKKAVDFYNSIINNKEALNNLCYQYLETPEELLKCDTPLPDMSYFDLLNERASQLTWVSTDDLWHGYGKDLDWGDPKPYKSSWEPLPYDGPTPEPYTGKEGQEDWLTQQDLWDMYGKDLPPIEKPKLEYFHQSDEVYEYDGPPPMPYIGQEGWLTVQDLWNMYGRDLPPVETLEGPYKSSWEPLPYDGPVWEKPRKEPYYENYDCSNREEFLDGIVSEYNVLLGHYEPLTLEKLNIASKDIGLTYDFSNTVVFEWFNFLNLYFSLGVDGISIFFVILSTFLIPLCILVSWENIKFRLKEFLLLLFFLEFLLI